MFTHRLRDPSRMPELNQLGFYACVRNGGEISSDDVAELPFIERPRVPTAGQR